MVWLTEDDDDVHQVRLFRVPIWCPSGGGGKREEGGTVAESLVGRSSALSGKYARYSVRAEGSSIVDETEGCNESGSCGGLSAACRSGARGISYRIVFDSWSVGTPLNRECETFGKLPCSVDS